MAAPVQALRLAGGGARSRLWAQMLADALAVPVLVAEGSEHGARGAAINAAVAIGLYASYAEAIEHMVRPAQEIDPTADQRDWWLEQLHLYRLERMAMTPVWKQRRRAE
jgi:sugar (pentulose or hexulose) kinase